MQLEKITVFSIFNGMRRIQLLEFEDFKWFPTIWRSTMTKLIVVIHKILGTKEVITDLLLYTREKYDFSKIVDMGSGSGGAMPEVIDHFNKENPNSKVELLLTDLHPNSKFVQSFNEEKRDNISYCTFPLDASNLAKTPKGLKMMVNSFHHMPPNIARKILSTAQSNNQPILIYEMGENILPIWVWVLTLPLGLPIVALTSILMLPFIKPLKFTDILFTWIIPLIPIFYAWDGQASSPRTYTLEDINEELLPKVENNYIWEIKHAKKRNGKKLGYYILGIPK